MTVVQRPLVQTLVIDGGVQRTADFETILFSRTHAFSFTGNRGQLRTMQYRPDGGTVRISRVTSTGHSVTLGEDEHASILAPRQGALSLRIGGRHHGLTAGSVALMPPQERRTEARARAGEGFVGDLLLVPMAEIAALAEGIDAPPPTGRDFRLMTGEASARLGGCLGAMLSELAQDGGGAGMSLLIRDLLAEAIAGQPDGAPGGRRDGLELARVRRAEEIMRGQGAEPVSAAELARTLGISLRSLQLAFQRVCGESPRSYHMRIRLEAARERLLAADPERDNVTAIAMECGFTHLGRFAGAYGRLFGETPSHTLSRQRRGWQVR